MDISVTDFKHRCHELIRHVEATGKPLSITRRGKVVAVLAPAATPSATLTKPWERLRGQGDWLASPEETFLSAEDIRGL